jgi:general secretion pathway protein I
MCRADGPLRGLRGRRADARGFTLLEVLIALVVLGLALTALVHAAGVSVRDFGGLRERSYAGWIAANVLTEARLRDRLPATGRRDGQQRFAGREWFWRLDVEGTQDPRLRRLAVQVYADAERSDPVAQLTGFAGDSVLP